MSRKLSIKIIINHYYKTSPTRTKSFKKSFDLFCIKEWNKLKVGIRNAKSFNIFKKFDVSEKQTNKQANKQDFVCCIYDPLGVKLLICLRLQFSHPNEHQFRHGFSDKINPTCACGAPEVETTEYFLCCPFDSTQKVELFENLEEVDLSFLSSNAKNQVFIVFYGSQTNNSKSLNHRILKNLISYLKEFTHFDRLLLKIFDK